MIAPGPSTAAATFSSKLPISNIESKRQAAIKAKEEEALPALPELPALPSVEEMELLQQLQQQQHKPRVGGHGEGLTHQQPTSALSTGSLNFRLPDGMKGFKDRLVRVDDHMLFTQESRPIFKRAQARTKRPAWRGLNNDDAYESAEKHCFEYALVGMEPYTSQACPTMLALECQTPATPQLGKAWRWEKCTSTVIGKAFAANK
ncbi:hypothetical protein BJ166DRAFT_589552 [Pestalotiopsis sp. NC0098]|nr:hypothetical protein BJ166DRAFT_589552 [Pestalotiopsis sp. NC0098]